MKRVGSILQKAVILPCIAASLLMTTSMALGSQRIDENTLSMERLAEVRLPESPVDLAHSLDGKYAFILTQRGKVLIYDRQGSLMGEFDAGEGATAIDIDPRGEILYVINGQQKRMTTIAVDFVVDIETGYAPFKGKADAPVTIAVFSDFQ